MKILSNVWKNKNLLKILKEGKIAVAPTDTIYGILGRAENGTTVEKIYELRRRSPQKPCIILIGKENELALFEIKLSDKQKSNLKKYWPGAVSIILDCSKNSFSYLHRGTKTLAFRMPASKELRNLLMATGPLIAPSANTEGKPPAKNIKEAEKYFGDSVDLYVDGGEIQGNASKVVRLYNDGSVSIIRR